MDRVNGQLDKVDKIANSAVNTADSVGTARRQSDLLAELREAGT